MQSHSHNDIAMLSDILDYLNTHEMHALLQINTNRLTQLESTSRENWARGDITIHRQLISIRQALQLRLHLVDDRDRWLKV